MSRPTSPSRIASLLASGTEILYGLGLGDRVVAVSHECDFPADAASKPRATSTRIALTATSRAIDDEVRGTLSGGAALYEIDVEVLARLRPDLIVTQAQCDVCAVRYADVLAAVERREELRQTAVVALNPLTFEDVLADILRVGQAVGVPQAAETYIAELRRRVGAVKSRTMRLPTDQRPRVACVEWIDPLMLAANWTPELIESAGGRHDLTKNGVHSGYASIEAVLDYDPEVVLIAPCGFDLRRTLEEAPTLTAMAGWDRLNAVRHGRVYACDGNAYFNRSGPRLVDTLELVAALIHPQLFGPCEASRGRIWERVA